MKILKFIFYKPYLLLFCYLTVGFTYNSIHNPSGKIINDSFLVLGYLLILRILFKFLKNALFKIINLFSIFSQIPDSVISGYLYIILVFQPIVVVIIAILAKLFIWNKPKEKTYIDEYGNEITQIKSLTPTVILSRKEQSTGEEEHIVMTKLKKKPRKIIYE